MWARDVDGLLQSLGFTVRHSVAGRDSIARLMPRQNRCGIYVLHFANGEHYVGQSVEVVRRFTDHRRNHLDVAEISFRAVPQPELDGEEERTIRAFERRGARLRNIDIVTQTYARTQFDDVMSVADQNRWLEDFRWVDNASPRSVDLAQRGRTAHKLRRLQRTSYADAVVRIARLYVRLGIPSIRRGEQRFWTITCMPGPVSVLCRVNVNAQEVMTLAIDDEEEEWLVCSLHLARLRLRDRLRLLAVGRLRHSGGIGTSDHRYAPGGDDQLNLVAVGEAAISALLRDRAVQAAIRRFSLRLMRRGPSLNARSHCIDLASLVLDGAITSSRSVPAATG